MPWPNGCSKCNSLHQSGNIEPQNRQHSTTIEHFFTEEPLITWRHGLCPTCRPKENPHEPIPTLTIQDRCKIYCESLNLTTRGAIHIAQQIATTTIPIMTSTGQSPHAHAAACVYTASHLIDAPLTPLAALLSHFDITEPAFRNAYAKVVSSRALICRARILRHAREWSKLPKPCCGRPPGCPCPRSATEWSSTVDECTGVQDGGIGAKGAWVGWVELHRGLGMDVELEMQRPDSGGLKEHRALRRVGLGNGAVGDDAGENQR